MRILVVEDDENLSRQMKQALEEADYVVDVAFDGAPLTKEYQNQLGRVIDKDGVAVLLRKVEKRRSEESKVIE